MPPPPQICETPSGAYLCWWAVQGARRRVKGGRYWLSLAVYDAALATPGKAGRNRY